MVLCKFFQQGNCRFGSKCTNDHIDVKQMVTTDVEAAIKGKQWIFSCYGPFKDKPCVPNFIADQSFEEIRFLCYESRQKNFFDEFNQQLSKEALDANNKLKALLQLTPDIVEIVSNVYDAPSENVNSGAAVISTSSFGSMGMGSNAASSIFAKSSTTTGGSVFGGGFGSTLNTGSSGVAPANGVGSIFGGATIGNNNQSNLFGAGTASLGFGANNMQQNSIFGQQQAKPANSIFGGGSTNQTSSIFGQTQSPATSGGLFGQATRIGGGSLFGQTTQQHPQQQQTGGMSLFGQSAPATAPTSFFGQQQSSPFLQKPVQQQQPPPNMNIFAQHQQQQPTMTQQNIGENNIFAQAGQNTNLFGQAAPTTSMQQPNPMTMQQQSSGNIFAQAVAQSQPQPSMGLFQQNMQQPQQQQQQLQMHQQLQPQPFIQQQHQQQQQHTIAGGSIANTALTANITITSGAYSRMEDLTAEEVESFKADFFSPGKLPFSPPPRELVN